MLLDEVATLELGVCGLVACNWNVEALRKACAEVGIISHYWFLEENNSELFQLSADAHSCIEVVDVIGVASYVHLLS